MCEKLNNLNEEEKVEIPKKVKDLTGKKFGKLKVLSFVGIRNGRAFWACECECQNQKTVAGRRLTSGNIKSCGCLTTATHGLSRHPLYSVWMGMMSRCYNSNNKSWKSYGGRNIRVCERWKDIVNFIEDMSPRPEGKSLDRIDNDGIYEPSNCRWATPKEQSANRRNNNLLCYKGKEQPLLLWAEEIGIKTSTLKSRLKMGWPVEEALTSPLRIGTRPQVTYDNIEEGKIEIPWTVKDLTGKKYGKLKVISFAGIRKGHACWLCECECQNKKVILGRNLTASMTRSCGCMLSTHGFTKHPLYDVWKGIMARCYNQKNSSFPFYGERGIKVCENWKIFSNFVKNMPPRPDGTTLDRIDNDGDYTPENCRWATKKKQNRNSRNNKVVEFKGESKTLIDWAERLNLNYKALWHRLKNGWSVEKAFTTPIKQYRRSNQEEKRNK